MGTVRMGADPHTGVVDPEQEGEWGTHGLFVAGSRDFSDVGLCQSDLDSRRARLAAGRAPDPDGGIAIKLPS